MTTYTTEQLEADVSFLLKRAAQANSRSLTGEGRFTGISSNSLTSFAYGGPEPLDRDYPSDIDDLASCFRTMKMIPGHRLSNVVWHVFWKYSEKVKSLYPKETVSFLASVEQEFKK